MGVSRKIGPRPDIGDCIVCMRHGYLHPMRTISARSNNAPPISRTRCQSAGLRLVAGLNAPESYGFAPAMADLVCYQDFSLVKGCEGKACVLLFLDRTHARARRWCSMSICGNRAKQAAHRKRSPGKPESKLLKRAKRAAPPNSRIQRSIHRTFLIKVGSKFRTFKYSFFPVRRRFIHKSRNGSHIQVMGQLARGLR